jgi:hypothetical protein
MVMPQQPEQVPKASHDGFSFCTVPAGSISSFENWSIM